MAGADAEDRPEHGQLRAALDAFRRNGADGACVQASLCIDYVSESWLSRMFAAEYAGQFDVFLPGFFTLHLPLPLGESFSHQPAARNQRLGRL
jgi:cellulose synthase/poly-beta-1,6-N-acetylglucosamine synthase-like glycosyltransferase